MKFKKFEIKNSTISKKLITKNDKATKMSKNDAIIEILEKVSGKKEVDMESHLELDLHLDSLAVAEIISNIEDQLNIKIEYDINARLSKVRDLVEFVNKHLKNAFFRCLLTNSTKSLTLLNLALMSYSIFI